MYSTLLQCGSYILAFDSFSTTVKPYATCINKFVRCPMSVEQLYSILLIPHVQTLCQKNRCTLKVVCRVPSHLCRVVVRSSHTPIGCFLAKIFDIYWNVSIDNNFELKWLNTVYGYLFCIDLNISVTISPMVSYSCHYFKHEKLGMNQCEEQV